jgi:type II secretory pathway pseudopilin PulG
MKRANSLTIVKGVNNSGYTLLEMAICICILGLLIGGGITDTSRFFAQAKTNEAKDRVEFIANVLSGYVQTHNRLPCPADANAREEKAGLERDSGKCSSQTIVEGPVPWKELAIPQSMTIDAKGQYIKYAPAPWLTADPQFVPPSTEISNSCRSAAWYDSTGNPLNRAKALFCCGQKPSIPNTAGMTVASDDTAAALNEIEPASGGATKPNSGLADIPHYMDGPAFPLASSQAAVTLTAGSGSDKGDIILSLNADQLYARTGQGSCTAPSASTTLPYACIPQSFGNDGMGTTPLYAVHVALSGPKFQLRATLSKTAGDDKHADSLGFYLVREDGTIDGVQILLKDTRTWPVGQTINLPVSWEAGVRAIGLFVIPNGFDWNDHYKSIDLSHLKFVFDYGLPDERGAKVTDQQPPTLVTVASNGETPILSPGGAFSAYHLYSNLNPGRAGRLLRAENICHQVGEHVGVNHDLVCQKVTSIDHAGVDPAHPSFADIGFEEAPNINCFELKTGGCAGGSVPVANILPDGQGGFLASVGDNAYDDLAFSIGLSACPLVR